MLKKGLAEVDWIVSIGIFLIFLALFFVYLTPFSEDPPDASDVLLFDVEKNLKSNTTWYVQRVPIIIHSNISSTEPIVASFMFDWTNISFSDNTTFYREENKIVFNVSLTKGPNVKWVVSSDEIYPQPSSFTDLAPTTDGVLMDSLRFQARFDGLLLSATHFKPRLTNFNISLDGQHIAEESADKEANFSNFAAKYKLSAPTVNHTTFIVGGYARLFNYVSPRQRFEAHNLTVSTTLHNYTHYFVDDAFSGPLNFTTQACKSKFSNYIDFYDSLSGVSFIMEDIANISFCTGNNSISLAILMGLKNEINYDILFHEGDYNATLKYIDPYQIQIGLVENLSGISSSLLRKLNETDYGNLKDRWNFPSEREFTFQLLNKSGYPVINYSPKRPGFVNVFTREFEAAFLDKYGRKTKHRLRIKGW